MTFAQSMFIIGSMQAVHLAGIDMNLLVALHALLTERSVTRAASRIGLTQPAMSHALARLRQLLGDPLFVRTQSGMEPTVRALGMAPILSRALGELQRALAEPPHFAPQSASRTFTISTSDYMEFVLWPTFVARVARAAPHVALHSGLRSGLEGLAAGAIDIALRPMPDIPKSGLHAEPIFEDRFVCLVRRGHPLARGKLTLDRYCAASHLLISPTGSSSGGIVDEQLARLHRSRRVGLMVQSFMVAPHVVAATDLIITLPAAMARKFSALLPLVQLEPPLRLPGLTMAQLWHERQAHDPALVWLRQELRLAAQELAVKRPRARAGA